MNWYLRDWRSKHLNREARKYLHQIVNVKFASFYVISYYPHTTMYLNRLLCHNFLSNAAFVYFQSNLRHHFLFSSVSSQACLKHPVSLWCASLFIVFFSCCNIILHCFKSVYCFFFFISFPCFKSVYKQFLIPLFQVGLWRLEHLQASPSFDAWVWQKS